MKVTEKPTAFKIQPAPLGKVVGKAKTWNPVRDAADSEFTYIDLSSIDQASKTITETTKVIGRDAPSRARQIVKGGDVLVATVRPNLNGVARVTAELDDATASTGFCVLRPEPSSIDGNFLFHWVKTPDFVSDMVRKSTGASYPAVSDRIILDSFVPLPPLSEQKRIAEILDRAEALRAKRRAALALLDELTQSIFLDMFGDAEVQDSKWTVHKIAEYVAEFQGGKSIESTDDNNSQRRVLKVSAVTGMKFRHHESKPIDDAYEPPDDHYVRNGDLLFSRANTTELVGAVAYVTDCPQNLLLPDKLWRFVWKDENTVHPLFIWYLFQTRPVRREIGNRATGTSGSMKNISKAKLFGIPTILPPFELQQKFAERINELELTQDRLKGSLTELDQLFASLQHRAFRGEL